MQELILTFENSKYNFGIVFEVAKHIMKIIIKIGLLGIISYNTYLSLQIYHSSLMIPIRIESKEKLDIRRTKEALVYLNAPKQKINILTESIIHGASIAKVDPVLIAVLMSTESEFNNNAKSSMGYKGLMQTATSTGLTSTDTMHGCEMLKSKLEIADNDIEKALTYYKGSSYLIKNGKKSIGYQQALQVLSHYKKTLDVISKA